ncbi:MAG: dihydroorotate dehydrogenase electron transfer subunit [Deltaproteobacteria bacterium]|nr:MAG: dihydroorotate dehydrogenase electron transfer subunit [Deltaproteobacteria bacterium]
MHEKQAMMTGEIIDNRCEAPDHFLMTVRLPSSFTTPAPGQFVMIREAGRGEPLLARPFSVFDFHRYRDDAVLEFLYRVAGRGTSLFSRMRPGDGLTLLGPLGRGFTLPAEIGRALLVAGGVGVAPLNFLFQSEFKKTGTDRRKEAIFYLGARSRDLLAGFERMSGFCDLRICTDDGSRGYRGPVTDLLKRDIDGYDPKETVVFACGPTPMIRVLGRLFKNNLIPCQVSLEERMACGIGACLGCAIAIGGPGRKTEYRKVCEDGPVFDLREILLTTAFGT